MGFGHRIYRAEDPRAKVLRRTAKELGSRRFEAAEALERAALAELHARKPDRVLAGDDDVVAPLDQLLDHARASAARTVPGQRPLKCGARRSATARTPSLKSSVCIRRPCSAPSRSVALRMRSTNSVRSV